MVGADLKAVISDFLFVGGFRANWWRWWAAAYISRLRLRRVGFVVITLTYIVRRRCAFNGHRIPVKDKRLVNPNRELTQQTNYPVLSRRVYRCLRLSCHTRLLRRWKSTMQDYYNRMHAMEIRLSGLLSTGLELDPDFFEDCFSESMSALRLLHYSSEV